MITVVLVIIVAMCIYIYTHTYTLVCFIGDLTISSPTIKSKRKCCFVKRYLARGLVFKVCV